jgi:hypothetical protein
VIAKSRVTALASAALLAITVGAPVFSNAFGSDDDTSGERQVERQERQREKDDDGQGPPAWSNAGGNHSKNDAWKQLSPDAKRDLMADLVSEHKAGMADFTECKRAGGTDCEKPQPPGLAKKSAAAKQ